MRVCVYACMCVCVRARVCVCVYICHIVVLEPLLMSALYVRLSLDVHYVCHIMLVQRFDPQGRRFTYFHYYYYSCSQHKGGELEFENFILQGL